jgi:hypothetical protein
MNTTFGIGNVLATGFRIWAKNFIPFMVITALIYSPVIIWDISALQGEMTQERLLSVARALTYSSILMIVLNILVSAALTYGVVMELQGQRASIGACIATGLARFFPVLGVAILSAICILGGTILLIVPGLIVFCMLYVSTQAAVLERPGVMGALSRSRELTSGHKLEIFGLLVVLGLLNYGLQQVVASVMFNDVEDLSRYVYALLAEQMIVGSLSAVMASVAYYFLRAEKEGTSASELAAIFD